MSKTSNAIWWLAAAHFLNDFFSGTMGIMLAAQGESIGLSNTQIGTAAALFLWVSLTQPVLGWMSDRYRIPHVMILGPMLTALGLLVIGFSTTYLLIIGGALIGGFGNAMFHPTGLAAARAFGGTTNKGRSVARFMFGGNFSFGISPFVVGFGLETFGPSGVAPFVLINLILMPIIFITLQANLRETLDATPPKKKPKATTTTDSKQPARKWYQATSILIGAYLLIVLMRNIIFQALNTFLPKYYIDQGRDLDIAGAATTMLFVWVAIGGLVATSLSDRLPRLQIVSLTLFLIAPLGWLLLAVDGIWIFILSIPFGFVLGAQWPILLIIGQEVLPGGASGASGLAFGWGFVANGGGTILAGAFADWIGLQETLQLASLLPIIGAALVFLLPAQTPSDEPNEVELSAETPEDVPIATRPQEATQ